MYSNDMIAVGQHPNKLQKMYSISHPVYRLAAAVADAYPHKTAGHSFCKEGHMTPALQLVSRQTDTI